MSEERKESKETSGKVYFILFKLEKLVERENYIPTRFSVVSQID